MAMTVEQERALAVAAARLRLQQQNAGAPTPIQLSDAPLSPQQLMAGQGLAADAAQRFNSNNATAWHDEFGGIGHEGGNPAEFAPPGLSEEMHRAGQINPGLVRSVLQGFTFNMADDLARVFGGQEAQDSFNADIARAQELSPGGVMAASLFGGVPWAVGGGALAAAPSTLLGQALVGAAVGAGSNAAYAAGNGENMLPSALIGGGAGVAAPFFGPLIGAATRRLRKPVPNASPLGGAGVTADEARAAGQADYQAANSLGVEVTRTSYDDAIQDIMGKYERTLMSNQDYTSARTLLNQLVDRGQLGAQSIEEIDEARQLISRSMRAADTLDESRIIRRMLDDYDAYLDGLTPADLVNQNVDPQQAMRLLESARDNWGLYRRIERLEDIAYDASLAAGATTEAGRLQALQRGFANFLKRGDTSGFTDAELAAIEAFVQQGNPLRTLTGLAPTMPRLLGTIGVLTGEPGLIIGAAAGQGATAMGNFLARRSLARMDTLVRRGPPKPPSNRGWLLPALQSVNAFGEQPSAQQSVVGPSRLFGPALPASFGG